ncbi:dihydrolipoyllysine-residue acetyltransferase component of pyruvate dehydrogenase complex, mitochondrial-like isoform X2 [Photinus pyralis]|uniref:dihydrolipoyllysine-residue acetyltransferase component of pyruvate dehydrogenase complex, mitochondrial-like isoform X2 n=1 Tax=Photinus pyralis TaxID=7054 RepID=UPI00126738D1|nr:dihydrolipoyllysine-residue acetyltransferase component of pyruvate dehydrogenase complex, mitochondrial-like isoform X2 [Photinus pyralis]
MLRTAFVRCNLLRPSVKKVIRLTIRRALTVEVSKRKHPNSVNCILQTGKVVWQRQLLRRYSGSFPPHTKVALPALSPTMNVGNIVSWEKKEGDQLQEGDVLAEIETDKATMGFETPEEGYLAKILIPAGAKEVPVGKLVCIIVEKAADVAAFKDYKDDGAPAGTAPSPAPSSPGAPAPPSPDAPPSPAAAPVAAAATPPPTGGRVYASPMAKKLAEQRQIRLEGKAAPSAAPAPKQKATPVPSGAAFIDIPLTNMRSVIAKRLLESKTTVPHYYVTVDCNIDKLLALRQKINKKNEKNGPKVSVNDFIVKATALACIAHPEVNSAWMDTAIRQYNDVDVSIAVSTPTGLITPIIFRANSKGIKTISKEVKELAGKAREGKLQPAEFQGGTITVSNLGMYGVAHFTAIINPPQCAILAMGGNQIRIIPDDNSEKGFKKAHFISATLSSDHRIVDGAKAAEWLSALREYIEAPEMMIF